MDIIPGKLHVNHMWELKGKQVLGQSDVLL